MHPTFNCEYRIGVSRPGQQIDIMSVGWGFFNIPMTIFFTKSLKKEEITIDHMLSFDGNGKSRVVNILMNKKRVADIL